MSKNCVNRGLKTAAITDYRTKHTDDPLLNITEMEYFRGSLPGCRNCVAQTHTCLDSFTLSKTLTFTRQSPPSSKQIAKSTVIT